MFEQKLFVLSPANCSGQRAQLLRNPRAAFDLATRLQSADGAELGEIFSFLSGLYFRGKLAYARRFAAAPAGLHPVLVISSDRGLVPPSTRVDARELEKLATVPIDCRDVRYREPLERDARRISNEHPYLPVVLLGSIATGKYVDILLNAFGARLHFPVEFAGRGDMSRGALMLRCVQSSQELRYAPVSGTTRSGRRSAEAADAHPVIRL